MCLSPQARRVDWRQSRRRSKSVSGLKSRFQCWPDANLGQYSRLSACSILTRVSSGDRYASTPFGPESVSVVCRNRKAFSLQLSRNSRPFLTKMPVMTTLTVENYLKTTLLTALKTGSDWVTTGQLATAMSVAPGTVTAMLKTLAETGHADYKPYEGVRLTDTGRAIALRMLRRHRLIELFLVKTLNLDWDQVHEEAENMEHAVSDHLVDRMDEYLGRPNSDPHGDPIPSADGAMRGHPELAIPLSTVASGSNIRIVRVVNQDGDFLRFLRETGFALHQVCRVVYNSPEAGIVTTEIDGRQVTLGHPAARQLLVESV